MPFTPFVKRRSFPSAASTVLPDVSVMGPLVQKGTPIEDTHVLAAIFVSIFGLLGGILEVAVWYGWRAFP